MPPVVPYGGREALQPSYLKGRTMEYLFIARAIIDAFLFLMLGVLATIFSMFLYVLMKDTLRISYLEEDDQR